MLQAGISAAVTFATSGFFAPPLRVSRKKMSPLSTMPFFFCVEVPAPLIPDLSACFGSLLHDARV